MKLSSLSALGLQWLAFSLLALATAGAHGASGDVVENCVELAPERQIVRSGDGNHFLLKNGDEHYKVSFRRNCASMPMASRISITADGHEGQLCPNTSVVTTHPSAGMVVTSRERCTVGTVTRIEVEEFRREQRRRR